VDSELIFPDPSPALNLTRKLGEVIKYYFLGKDWLARLCNGSILISTETTNLTALSLNIALNGAVFV
jgi:hypothetical protein